MEKNFIDDGKEFMFELEKKMNDFSKIEKDTAKGHLKSVSFKLMTEGFMVSKISDETIRAMIIEDNLSNHIVVETRSGVYKYINTGYLNSREYKKMSLLGFKYRKIILISKEAVNIYIDRKYYNNKLIR